MAFSYRKIFKIFWQANTVKNVSRQQKTLDYTLCQRFPNFRAYCCLEQGIYILENQHCEGTVYSTARQTGLTLDSRENYGLPDTLEQDDPMPCSALARKRTP
jgi:hypothetical protein